MASRWSMAEARSSETPHPSRTGSRTRRSPRGAAAREGQAPGDPSPGAGSGLIQAIARLDEQYRRGELAEDQYRRTRQGLKSQVLAPYDATRPVAEGSAAAGDQGG